MPKTRKRKSAVTASCDELTCNSSSSRRTSRTTIRKFHVLLKRKTQLQNIAYSTENAQELANIEREIEEMGGLSVYQRMSTIGQGNNRGGGCEKELISWLKEIGWADASRQSKHRCVIAPALESCGGLLLKLIVLEVTPGSWRSELSSQTTTAPVHLGSM